ncbi:MAG: hypothetical protein ACYTDW_03145 [Planctomycetota bacterium]
MNAVGLRVPAGAFHVEQAILGHDSDFVLETTLRVDVGPRLVSCLGCDLVDHRALVEHGDAQIRVGHAVDDQIDSLTGREFSTELVPHGLGPKQDEKNHEQQMRHRTPPYIE